MTKAFTTLFPSKSLVLACWNGRTMFSFRIPSVEDANYLASSF